MWSVITWLLFEQYSIPERRIRNDRYTKRIPCQNPGFWQWTTIVYHKIKSKRGGSDLRHLKICLRRLGKDVRTWDVCRVTSLLESQPCGFEDKITTWGSWDFNWENQTYMAPSKGSLYVYVKRTKWFSGQNTSKQLSVGIWENTRVLPNSDVSWFDARCAESLVALG